MVGQSAPERPARMKSATNSEVWTAETSKKKCCKYFNNSYLIEIKPLLLLLRLFGRFPYSFGKDGELKFKLCSIPVVYTALFFILQTLWTSYSLTLIGTKKIAKSNSFDETLFWVANSVFLLQNYVIPHTFWLEAPKTVKYIALWKIFQDNFCEEGLKLKMRVKIMILSALVIPSILLLLWVESYLIEELSILVFVPYISAMGGSYVFILLWALTLHEIRNMSRDLCSKLLSSGLKNISSSRLLWLRLSSLSTNLGETGGHTGLTTLAVLFVTFVLSSYGILALLFDSNRVHQSFWGLFIATFLCLIMKIIICDAADRTTQTVGQNFSQKLLELDLSSFPHLKHEISLFLQTMSANQPIIQFYGFVTVNRALFISFISNTVTYLVVLLQFKTSALSAEIVNATKAL